MISNLVHSEDQETKLNFNFNLIINELSCVPLLHGVLFLHWRVGHTEGFSPHFPVKEHQIEFRMRFVSGFCLFFVFFWFWLL